ncbi:redoxin domain-containing protein [Nocardioides sp. dk4132]|uniref:NHL domain-containing thioredoxin family protein n=1 Tax=unclassified Nocardioides TaxID=2615069 RepID=UPI0012950256|nr:MULTISPECIES: NHL domain-containing thioredoxin family protein [unclassified Nocardioides]MQW77498.1 redoxin domain-containing protein [Nocardioides sp. dk4132]QGA09297.1 redoxin domain-containing protein [Nocardioides sp. dk884]
MSTRPRVRAPELEGRGWLNTDGPLTLKDLRGRFVLLDFWTFCCINCLHVLDELRAVEEEYAEELVVIGVHSPKFVHEADPVALAQAVERYSVHHPVLDDPDLVTWRAYTARAWPTLVLIDPEGYVVAQYAGEGHAHAIAALLGELVPQHRERGTLQPGDSPYVPVAVEPTDLRFPAKAVPVGDGRVLVADAGHDAVVELGADGAARRRFEGFREPNGLCLLPPDVAAEVGYDVVVADTVAHRLRGISLADGEVRTLAGDGTQWMQGDGTDRLSSPWDVAWWQDRVWVAMAGIHQLWTLDPRTGAVEVVVGTSNEGLLDGPGAEAWLAQTSGLAPDGDRLWLADSETSALRWVEASEDGAGWAVRTAVGSGLFDFGFRDGPAEQALLQHPLGVTVLPDGSVAVCDTYNGALRRFDPATGEVSTLATDLAEPSGAYVDTDTGTEPAQLVVVESGAHRLTRVPLGAAATRTDGFAHTTQRPVTDVPAELELVITFEPPPGQKVDDRFGPATQLIVEATPPALLREGAGRGTDLVRRLVLDRHVGDGVLHVAARAASCDADGGEGAACRMHQQDWGVPVRISDAAAGELHLPLGGVPQE